MEKQTREAIYIRMMKRLTLEERIRVMVAAAGRVGKTGSAVKFRPRRREAGR